ncbi:UDP-N-acetylglucosamine--N-acetylmuramyl-(pentapeptide) pyrophosphoryl-undecaprenol N-acetylglucosamine transferase [Glaciihabitans arcticus]|uniref:UDP-N-acetylglucosamine--N-acetylmuramyl-(pentapeptide) pyrophosphoryl-undecaprenol N-acetylglucosamine transferase n=1 Tax=Glaciihabitans arcticus TaxID=2668039 RepID=A0A4Q9GP13_9MICO|nr:UDP-N-acetylglucosamine--N-acetylmuramyl-(pentapeptide) pyrophosphoryl-undecaprenol N-acetylglucosamine transferase [Glaciihabitans arcticus]TBN56552.1 UDP-N-acetylglucosamine--N-acetylmuramyl-(pentapeptide) pyrophosphoryl-undecaprenol N-acetylglucosamine transferase [Glaciihabitans arcticus]
MTTYLLAGGGTAGHVNPLLATADRLRDRDPDAEILVIGTAEGLEARLVPARGYELITVARLPFPRRPNRAALSFPKRLRSAVDEVVAIIADRGVDVIVGFGGYASAPAYLAARRTRTPLVVHEANARPGIANRLGSWITRFVGVAFASTRIRNATFVGMPLRREIEQLDRHAARAEGIRLFGFDNERPVLLVTGGSTGARSINATIAESAPLLLGAGWQVLHIVGEKSELEDPRLDGYTLLRYCDRMDLAIAVAELAVARSGSATVSEFSAVGLAAVYVPYPVGNGEQRFNAADVVAAGGAMIVADAQFTPAWVASTLVPLLRDRALLAEMATLAATTGVSDGADRMADLVARALASATPASA